MNRIESKITKKYLDTDFEKYCRMMKAYWKIRNVVKYIPNVVKSSYMCLRFPFLKFHSSKGPIVKSCWLWQIDKGWRKAFGIQMCKEIKASLKRNGCLKTYRFTSVKEKYGVLTIYDDGAPGEVHDIINKYEYISARTCINCGRPALYRTAGWVEPYCDDCIKSAGTNMEPLKAYEDYEWYGYKKYIPKTTEEEKTE